MGFVRLTGLRVVEARSFKILLCVAEAPPAP